MIITSLRIRNFRNLTSVDLELSPGINLFFGRNAQGKTAILEAVAYLATSTSHRAGKDEEMIRWEQPAAFVSGQVQTEVEELTLEFGLSFQGKQVKVGGQVLKRIRDLYGLLRVVLFVPEDLEIIGGGPSERRRFLDLMISQLEPDHITRLQRYQQVIRSRNQLLKQAEKRRLDPVEIETWDVQLIETAIPVIETRMRAIVQLTGVLEEFGKKITSGRETLRARYQLSVQPAEGQTLQTAFEERLVASRLNDIKQGATSFGPHRDDIQFILNGKDLRKFGSQGQRRTAALALRLAEFHWLRENTDSQPVMLLDDVIYEMDEGRRNLFFEQIGQAGQVLITATEPEHLAPLVPRSRLFRVDQGRVQDSSDDAAV